MIVDPESFSEEMTMTMASLGEYTPEISDGYLDTHNIS